ncbi:hypothetical protein, partial [Staphylococcus aureus]
TDHQTNATKIATEEARKAVQVPETAQPAYKKTVKEEVVKDEAKPKVMEKTKAQDKRRDQKQLDITPK